MQLEIVKYQSHLQKIWDDFIPKTSRGTFLHLRRYLDYHANRFEDYSLMFFNGAKLIGVLPAHRKNDQIFSHNGLTYGDFLIDTNIFIDKKIELVKQALLFLKKKGFKTLDIKTVPEIFHRQTDQSNEFIFNALGGNIQMLMPFFAFENSNYSPNRNRKRSIRKALNFELKIYQNNKLIDDFWILVHQNLKNRYQAQPVHTIEEIRLLMQRFPEKILLFGLCKEQELSSGALVYLFDGTLHFQYVHSTLQKDSRNAVDFLIDQIFSQYQDKYRYFSLGSSQVAPDQLNKSLVYWKESFGSKIFNQYFYSFNLQEIDLTNEILL